MTQLFLAGDPADPVFAQVEQLAHFMAKNLPDFQITVIFKNSDQWLDFATNLYIKNFWGIRAARDLSIKQIKDLPQIVWYSSGELIGNGADFFEFTKLAYNLDKLSDDAQLLSEITRENLANGTHGLIC